MRQRQVLKVQKENKNMRKKARRAIQMTSEKRIAPKMLLCGPEGSGKSFMGAHIARRSKRLIAFDLNEQDGLAQGAHVVRTCKELKSVFDNADGRKKLHVCFRPQSGNIKDLFTFVCGVAARYKNVTIFADEAESLIHKNKDLPEPVLAVMTRGRHVGVPVILTSQRPQNLHVQIRGNCQKIALFRSFDATYANYIKTNFQMPDDSRNILSALNSLEDYGYILVENGEPWRIMKKYQNT